jgi:hypothetical protein
MDEPRTCENFPAGIVLLSNSLAAGIYAVGACILAGLGIWPVVLYLAYCLAMEIRVLQRSCVNCCYYGKLCAFGKGKLCSWVFSQGDPKAFTHREISWQDIVPDFLVFILPLIGGILLSLREFSWPRVALLALLPVLSFVGNAVVRGSFACKFCRQRELGCPAQKLFTKKQEQ